MTVVARIDGGAVGRAVRRHRNAPAVAATTTPRRTPIAERFDAYAKKRRRIELLNQQIRKLELANATDEAFVKEWFRDRPTVREHLSVRYACTTYRALDVKRAREMLGDQALDAEIIRTRETLTVAG